MARIRAFARPDFEEIDASVLTLPVAGRRLRGTRFEDELAPQGTLIVFLRHLGCSFCAEMIVDVRNASRNASQISNADKAGTLDILFVHQGPAKEAEKLFMKLWPEARAIVDSQRKLYGAFKVDRGSMLELFGPKTLLRGIAAIAKGHLPKTPAGDPLLMPGLFFVKDRKVAWQHVFRHIGDRPDFKGLPNLLKLG